MIQLNLTLAIYIDLQILKNDKIKVELEVQALKTGCTVVKEFEYYWPLNLSEQIWKEAHQIINIAHKRQCPKCGKTGFPHRASHFTTRIKPYMYSWGEPLAHKGFHRKPRH